MAQTFNRFISSAVGNTATSIGGYTVASGTAVVVGLLVSNPTGTGDINIDITFSTGSGDVKLGNDITIPYGQSLIVIGWDQKIVMKVGDSIKINTTGVGQTADVILSVMEVS